MENLPFERVISTSRKGSLPSFSVGKRNVRMLAVKKVKKKWYVVQGSEKKKTVIDVTSIQKGFESRRTVVKPLFLMERHEDIGKERA